MRINRLITNQWCNQTQRALLFNLHFTTRKGVVLVPVKQRKKTIHYIEGGKSVIVMHCTTFEPEIVLVFNPNIAEKTTIFPLNISVLEGNHFLVVFENNKMCQVSVVETYLHQQLKVEVSQSIQSRKCFKQLKKHSQLYPACLGVNIVFYGLETCV